METKSKFFGLLSIFAMLGACGGDDEVCDPLAQTGCEEGQVCEYVEAGDPACFAPVVVRGQVFDLQADTPVAEAHIVGLDINGAATSSVAISDANGDYELTIPSMRDAEGAPIPVEMTLRADAAGYQTFPSGVRQSLPIDTGGAVDQTDALVVQSALTDIGLLALPDSNGLGTIHGTVELPADAVGILVVAESAGGVGHAGIANRDGEYRIFNLPADSYTVTGYARGVNYMSQSVELAQGGDEAVDLTLDGALPGIVSGDVQIVNGGGDNPMTSVILAVESTFDDDWGRGQTVPGLRAPEPGIAGNVVGAYEITGVPVGNYVVLAAFENDNLVRDPDLSISGTATLHIEVSADTTTVVEGFKVTEALEIFSPGAGEPEEITGPPTFSWKDDSSEDEYSVEVFDAFGELIWQTSIPGQSGQDPSVDYAGPALIPGMYYQFRATSIKNAVPISRTEDLRGVFYTATTL